MRLPGGGPSSLLLRFHVGCKGSRYSARQGFLVALATLALCSCRPVLLSLPVSSGMPVSAMRQHPQHDRDRGSGEDLAGHELAEAAAAAMETLRVGSPTTIDGFPETLHELPNAMSEKAWHELDQLLTANEEPLVLDGSKWVSLRLDGCLWRTLTSKWRSAGIIEHGYSAAIAEAMCACCRAVMDEFKASVTYSHSDEIVVLLSPRRMLEDGRQLDFPFAGRVQKWVSIAASVATALFNRRLGNLAAERGVALDESMVAHFRCRVGVFNSELEASALLLSRAHHCSTKSLQDACSDSDAPAHVLEGGLVDKLKWLRSADLLPLKSHQAYGSLFAKGKGEFDCVNPDINETVSVTRGVNVHVNDGANGTPQNLLNLLANGLPIIPPEEDPRMGLRPGSFWRYAGPSGTGGESKRDNRRSSPRGGGGSNRDNRRSSPREGRPQRPGRRERGELRERT